MLEQRYCDVQSHNILARSNLAASFTGSQAVAYTANPATALRRYNYFRIDLPLHFRASGLRVSLPDSKSLLRGPKIQDQRISNRDLDFQLPSKNQANSGAIQSG